MPDYWPTVFAARFWGVPPWVMMTQPIYWVQVAEDVANAEEHVRDRRERAQQRQQRANRQR
jgi:hypothetical protein